MNAAIMREMRSINQKAIEIYLRRLHDAKLDHALDRILENQDWTAGATFRPTTGERCLVGVTENCGRGLAGLDEDVCRLRYGTSLDERQRQPPHFAFDSMVQLIGLRATVAEVKRLAAEILGKPELGTPTPTPVEEPCLVG